MELKTAIEILEYHQEWRLGKREDMIHVPKKLTQALDIVLSEVKNGEVQKSCESEALKLFEKWKNNYKSEKANNQLKNIEECVKQIK